VITALRAREYPDVEHLQSQTIPKDRNPIDKTDQRFKGMINLAATAIALK
jgi:hypothetical protein